MARTYQQLTDSDTAGSLSDAHIMKKKVKHQSAASKVNQNMLKVICGESIIKEGFFNDRYQ